MMRGKSMRILTLGAVLALALTGCKHNSDVIPIKTLLDDPTHYDHQVVRISGEVQKSMGVLGYGAYQVNDGTAMIAVVTNGGGAPRTGARVGVEGEFRSAFTLGTETAAVIMEHQRITR